MHGQEVVGTVNAAICDCWPKPCKQKQHNFEITKHNNNIPATWDQHHHVHPVGLHKITLAEQSFSLYTPNVCKNRKYSITSWNLLMAMTYIPGSVEGIMKHIDFNRPKIKKNWSYIN